MLFSSSLAGSFFPTSSTSHFQTTWNIVSFPVIAFSILKSKSEIDSRFCSGIDSMASTSQARAHVVQVLISPSSTTQIVDSVIALFRVDFTRRGELAERQQKPDQMLSRLTKIAEEFNVSVYNDKPRF
ncbi:hypothetical protein L6452_06611 [Arctium lappa]|uniref:Uncharacterized protein n=1 Tax=Arctium lappa TaxID=4217 RepID=A0ACB9EJ16_ARCLA|nr:hypothetical protein L6452_06611 [Arctium lappa]